MPHEVPAKRSIKGYRDEWNNHDREDCVTGQDREVDGPRETCALKTSRAVVVVISEIGSQKKYRNYQRPDLTGAMRNNISGSDKSIARK